MAKRRRYENGRRVKVSEDQLKQYAKVLKDVQEAAGVPIESLFNALDLGAAASEAVLVEAVAWQVEEYGAAMAEAVSAFLQQQLVAVGDTVAAEAIRTAMADALAEAAPVDVAPIASRARYEIGRAKISPAMKPSAAGTMNADTQARVKRRGYEVADDATQRANKTLESQGRRPVEWWFAWVPQSPTPCAFCITVASNGWRRAQKRLVDDHKNEIHPNCSCLLVIKNKWVDIEGYDPDYYLSQYTEAAKHATGKGSHAVINSLQRQLYADADKYGDRIRAQHRAQYRRTHPKDE